MTETRTITVALLQMTACGDDQAANRDKGEEFCRASRHMGADIALFPEMWNIGYAWCPDDPTGRARWQAQAIGAQDEFVGHFRKLARKLQMAIALTYLERWPGAPRDSVSLIDRRGEIVMTYAKVHTCDFSHEAACTPGEEFFVTRLNTKGGDVEVGAMICFDREFPESARILMLKGAELILTPNACTLDEHRIGQFKARAYENMVGVAMTNYAAPQCNGHSVAFDAAAYASEGDPDGSPLQTLIVEAGEDEGVYFANFDMERIREYREREVWGNAFRKPRAYDLLTSREVTAPFVRKSARR